MQTSLDLALI